MKKFICFTALVGFIFSIRANTYYFSTITGDDSRTTVQAQNSATPWKSLTKLNSFLSNLLPGDSILFKRGEAFDGSLKITVSGTLYLPIVFSAYGTGNKPVINGLKKLSDWVQKNKGIWESSCASCGVSVNIVLINGVEQAMGRYPNSNSSNKGYLIFKSHIDTTKIMDKQLRIFQNWKGAELVIRSRHWIIDRNKIKSNSGNTITYVPSSSNEPFNGFGYFIQDHINTLDQPGEWFYNRNTKKMNVYFGVKNPKSFNIELSVFDTLVYLNGQTNVVFDDLSFIGANEYAFKINNGKNITITNCNIRFSGADGISIYNANDTKIKNNKVSNTNNNAVQLLSCFNSIIKNNIIKNTGLYAGMGKSGNNTYEALIISGNNNLVENNIIDSTGYVPIKFAGDSVLIKDNFINYFTLVKDDGGGIYTFTASSIMVINHDRKLTGNIILNGKNASEGTYPPDKPSSVGIYMDDRVGNVEIVDNSIANCTLSGIFLHNTHEITVTKNTLFNNGIQLKIKQDKNCSDCLIKNNLINNNILFSKEVYQFISDMESNGNNITDFGVFDNNYYCRPLDDNLVIYDSYISSSINVAEVQNLQSWQSVFSKDTSSYKSPFKIPLYKINQLVKKNKFINGNFQHNIKGVHVHLPKDTCNISWNNGKIDGGALQFSFSSVSKKIGRAHV